MLQYVVGGWWVYAGGWSGDNYCRFADAAEMFVLQNQLYVDLAMIIHDGDNTEPRRATRDEEGSIDWHLMSHEKKTHM